VRDDALRRAEEALRAARHLLAERRATKYIPHAPTPKQRAFLERTELESLFGGAAGGGKTDALLMAALEHVHVPGYAALLLRRTYPELALPGALMSRSHEWLTSTKARWNGEQKQWRFPSGATLSFGFLETERDKFRYQSAEFQFCGFDELSQFSEAQYTYLLSRLRRLVGSEVPIRMRAATNPGGSGHDWVKARFVAPGHASRPFIPSRLEDNPHLDQAAYREALSRLDSTTRAQLERGEWIRDSGGLIYPITAQNLVPLLPVMRGLRWGLGIDLGAGEREASTALVKVAWHDRLPGLWTVATETHASMIPSRLGERVMELEREVGRFDVIALDEGGLGRGYGDELRQRFGIAAKAAQKANKLGYRKLLRGELEQALVLVVEPQCEALIQECAALEWDEQGLDCARNSRDHCSDAWLYVWRAARAYAHDAPTAHVGSDLETEMLEREQQARARKQASHWLGS
jgi:hypothetical protein